MAEEKSSPVGIIVVVAVIAGVIGVMIGKSGSKAEPVVENQPPAEQEGRQEAKPVEDPELKSTIKINMASIGNKKIVSYISEQLKKPSAELTDEDFAAVKNIRIHHFFNFDDISIVSKCVNLQSLDLMNGGILKDIKPLENLTKLESISLWGTKVSDLSPLSKLMSLKHLNLKGCPVNDLAPLHGLKSLQIVDGVGEISKEQSDKFVEYHPYVVIDYANQSSEDRIECNIRRVIRNFTSELTDEDYAKVKNIRIHHFFNFDDISIVSKCVNLQSLDLMNGGILKDIKPLENLTKLESISLWGTKVSDLSPLSKLMSLKHLNLRGCPVTDITPLSKLKNLKMVDGLKKELADQLRKALPNCEFK